MDTQSYQVFSVIREKELKTGFLKGQTELSIEIQIYVYVSQV